MIKLATNNGQSRHSIDCFKFKLIRKICYNASSSNKSQVETCEYLNYNKIPGCKKFETVSKDYMC